MFCSVLCQYPKYSCEFLDVLSKCVLWSSTLAFAVPFYKCTLLSWYRWQMAGPSFDAKSKLKLVKICFYLRRRPPPGPETPPLTGVRLLCGSHTWYSGCCILNCCHIGTVVLWPHWYSVCILNCWLQKCTSLTLLGPFTRRPPWCFTAGASSWPE